MPARMRRAQEGRKVTRTGRLGTAVKEAGEESELRFTERFLCTRQKLI